jgi:putative flippase GtrA
MVPNTATPTRFKALQRQVRAFVLVGAAACVVHYAVLIGLVEWTGTGAVPSTLAGYGLGGVTSYRLSRRYVFTPDRRHQDAIWRFMVVAGIGFGLTALIMSALVALTLPYLPAQFLTTGVVLFWSFLANRIWTFSPSPVVP